MFLELTFRTRNSFDRLRGRGGLKSGIVSLMNIGRPV